MNPELAARSYLAPDLTRIISILIASAGAHLAVLAVRAVSRRILRSRVASQGKVLTLTRFASSTAVFILYFLAVGYLLREFGVSLTAYLASASVIGLAVSFGSQGLVQDVITGLTVVFLDLLDVGDMVEVSGQVGIVEKVGVRFTVLVSLTGAQVFIPNRTVANVINYRRGYVPAFLDARLPGDSRLWAEAEREIGRLAKAAHEQFPGIMLGPPTALGREETTAGFSYVRVEFPIWPGQGALVETSIKQSVVQGLRGLDPDYTEWMVAVHYRAEPADGDAERQLPRPAVAGQGPKGN